MKTFKKLIKQLSKTHVLSHRLFKPIAIFIISAFILLCGFDIYSRNLSHMTDSINPDNVQWQYFFLDESGKISTQTTLPKGKKPIAIINGATFAFPKSDTPKLLKKNIARILTPENADLSVALPREDLATMQRYYGETEFIDGDTKVEDVYS